MPILNRTKEMKSLEILFFLVKFEIEKSKSKYERVGAQLVVACSRRDNTRGKAWREFGAR